MRNTNSKIRMKGPASNLPPPDLKLEEWMVDAGWVPEGRPATLTFLRDSVPGDRIGVIINNALHTWNKGSQASAIGYDRGRDGSGDKGEGGSGLKLGRVAGNSTSEGESEI